MPAEAPSKPVEILLVEDNPADADLIQESLAEAGVQHRLSVIENGAEALAFLRRQGKYANAVRPALIVLDLSLPVKDGRETLRDIKGDDDLKRIPVVVLTTSNKPEDVLRCYDLHANCYLTKPLLFTQYVLVMKGIQEFWFTLVTLPSEVQT